MGLDLSEADLLEEMYQAAYSELPQLDELEEQARRAKNDQALMKISSRRRALQEILGLVQPDETERMLQQGGQQAAEAFARVREEMRKLAATRKFQPTQSAGEAQRGGLVR